MNSELEHFDSATRSLIQEPRDNNICFGTAGQDSAWDAIARCAVDSDGSIWASVEVKASVIGVRLLPMRNCANKVDGFPLAGIKWTGSKDMLASQKARWWR